MGLVDFSLYRFHAVMHLPVNTAVLDLSESRHGFAQARYTIGKYDEARPLVYQASLFKGGRNVHVGIDLGAPAGEPVFSFWSGEIHALTDHQQAGDYGPTVIIRHEFSGTTLYALYGHLQRSSLARWRCGQEVVAGATIGEVGVPDENGGWPPHLHFQLSYIVPRGGDLPGTVHARDRAWALRVFPDPRQVLGPIY